MAMATTHGLVGAAPRKLASTRWGISNSSLLSSESFLVRAARASSASSSSSSSSATAASEIFTFAGRGSLIEHHENFLTQRRRRMMGQISAAGGEGGEEPKETVPDRFSLKELDEQLKAFASRETSLRRQTPVPRQGLGDPSMQRKEMSENWAKLQLPAFTPGFFVFAGIVLFLLTIFNNVLYNYLADPPVVDRKEVFKSSVQVMPRYRVTTRQEEADARDAKKAQREAIAAQSREAPLPSE